MAVLGLAMPTTHASAEPAGYAEVYCLLPSSSTSARVKSLKEYHPQWAGLGPRTQAGSGSKDRRVRCRQCRPREFDSVAVKTVHSAYGELQCTIAR